jgi:diaminopimelate epimerase
MCGNAIRCVGKYYYETYINKTQNNSSLTVETLSGIKHLTLNIINNKVDSVTVDMGIPSLQPADIPILTDTPFINQTISIDSQNNCALCIVHCALAVSMGNPHLILPIDDIDNYPLHQLGPLWENHPLFPDRVNTEIVEQLSPTHLRMRVWERGSGETLACGTGACAVVVAFTHLGRIPKGEPITVSLIGGNLTITYRDDNHVLMQGTATEVFRGQINF